MGGPLISRWASVVASTWHGWVMGVSQEMRFVRLLCGQGCVSVPFSAHQTPLETDA